MYVVEVCPYPDTGFWFYWGLKPGYYSEGEARQGKEVMDVGNWSFVLRALVGV